MNSESFIAIFTASCNTFYICCGGQRLINAEGLIYLLFMQKAGVTSSESNCTICVLREKEVYEASCVQIFNIGPLLYH